MTIWNCYYLAHSIEDALQALAKASGPARLVAGGTDLLLELQQGRQAAVDTLVDITQIPELKTIEVTGERLFIGAAVPLHRLVDAPLVCQHAQALVEACGQVGGPQVRNVATLGGNVAHALPAADGSIALHALDAQAELAGCSGRRTVPITDLYLGPGRSILTESRELLVGFWLPLSQPGQASAFRRVMRPQGVALPVLNLAAWLQRDGNRLAGVRIAIGPAGLKPLRALQTEQALLGQPLDEPALAKANEALLGEARFRTSPQRATAEYRRHLAGVLLRQVLALAWERAGNELPR